MQFVLDSFQSPQLKQAKVLTSISTKLTTANWSPDHTSRAPTPVMEEAPNPRISQIQQNIEKLNIHLKYFRDLAFQLKTSLESEINKLNIKKSQMIAEIELKFSEDLHKLKLIFNEKSGVLNKTIKEISNEISKNLQVITEIWNGNDIDQEFIQHLIRFPFKNLDFDCDWLKIRGNQDVIFYERKEMEGRGLIISTLHCERDGGDSICSLRVYVPFGEPAYSFYYLVKTSNGGKVCDLGRSLKEIWGYDKKLSVFYKKNEFSEMVIMKASDNLPSNVNAGWPRLFVKFN
jgi:hypothetical protein